MTELPAHPAPRWQLLRARPAPALLQVLLWALLGGFYFAWNNRPNFHFTGPVWPLVLLQMGFAVLLFNSLVYLVIPRWLVRGHGWRALAGGGGLLCLYRAWNYAGASLAVAYLPLSPDLRLLFHRFYIDPFWQSVPSAAGMLFALVELLAQMLFPLVVSFVAYALVVDRRRLALERDHFRLELSCLKAQINPQFLFNALHSLHGLTRTRDPRAGDAVLHLADLMRYTLYETDAERVPLAGELEFMADYLALERLHLPDAVVVAHEVIGTATTQQLAPLLLHPFLERLFAGLAAAGAGHVRSTVRVAPGEVALALARTAAAPLPAYRADAAVGAALRRLQLQYPGRHAAQITEDGGRLEVHISIQL